MKRLSRKVKRSILLLTATAGLLSSFAGVGYAQSPGIVRAETMSTLLNPSLFNEAELKTDMGIAKYKALTERYLSVSTPGNAVSPYKNTIATEYNLLSEQDKNISNLIQIIRDLASRRAFAEIRRPMYILELLLEGGPMPKATATPPAVEQPTPALSSTPSQKPAPEAKQEEQPKDEGEGWIDYFKKWVLGAQNEFAPTPAPVPTAAPISKDIVITENIGDVFQSNHTDTQQVEKGASLFDYIKESIEKAIQKAQALGNIDFSAGGTLSEPVLPPDMFTPESREYAIQQIVKFINFLQSWETHVEDAQTNIFQNIEQAPWSTIKATEVDEATIHLYKLEWLKSYLNKDALVHLLGSAKATEATLGDVVKDLTTKSTIDRGRERVVEFLSKSGYDVGDFINKYGPIVKEAIVHTSTQVQDTYNWLEKLEEEKLTPILKLVLKPIDKALTPAEVNTRAGTNTLGNIGNEFSEYAKVVEDTVGDIKQASADTLESIGKKYSEIKETAGGTIEDIKNVDYRGYAADTVSSLMKSANSTFDTIYNYFYHYEDYKLDKYLMLPAEELCITLDENIQTPAHVAINAGNLEALKVFLDRVPDFIEDVDSSGQTLLHIAIKTGNIDIVTYLIQKKEESNPEGLQDFLKAKTSNQQTAACFATLNGHLDILKLLLEKDPSLAVEVDKYGDTLLHTAAKKGQLPIVKYLCENAPEFNLDVNAKNKGGMTAAIASVRARNYTVAKYFSENESIDKTIEESYGKTFDSLLKNTFLRFNRNEAFALLKEFPEYAKQKTSKKINFLQEQDALGNTMAHLAIREGSLEEAKQLLRYDPDLGSITNGEGKAIAILLAERGDFKLIVNFLQEFKNLNLIRKDRDETTLTTVAHMAASANDYDSMLEILKLRPDLALVRNVNGETIAHTVARNLKDDVLKDIFIISPEAKDIKVKNKEGKELTPYDLYIETSTKKGTLDLKKVKELAEALKKGLRETSGPEISLM